MDDIKRKVRSLLAVAAPGSGATGPERDTAQSLATKLMARHGLKESDIPQRQVEGARRHAPPPPEYTAKQVVKVFVGGLGGFNFDFDGGVFNFDGTNTTTGRCG